MRKKLQTILMAGLISFSVNSMADIAGDLASNLPVNEVLMNAVNSGMTLADAVGAAVAASPEKAGDIVAAASACRPKALTCKGSDWGDCDCRTLAALFIWCPVFLTRPMKNYSSQTKCDEELPTSPFIKMTYV